MRFVQVNKKKEEKKGIRAVDTIHSCVHGSRVREKCFISFLSFFLSFPLFFFLWWW
jgi:hypothetical protein